MKTRLHLAQVRRALLCLVVTALPLQIAWSQQFPVRPIRLVVGFAPGGSTDIVARIVAKEMSSQLGQQVLVENKPGASAAIATEYVAKAAPDGYTLCFCTLGAMVILPMIEPKLAYKPDKELAPVTHVVNQPFVVVVRSSLGVNDLKEFIALAKASPGKITFGSPGTATPSHLTGELLALATGTKLTHVPYRGDAPSIQDLLGGQIDSMMLSAIGVEPLVKSGRVKALAVSSLTRLNFMPDLPTIAESGYPGFQTNNLQALFAPAGTPPEVINKLNAAAVAALKTPDAVDKIAGQGLIIVADTPASLARTMRDETVRWGNVVKQLNLKNE
jgi:tripartite-type tricarboxylate transporter receptor subunit TctC